MVISHFAANQGSRQFSEIRVRKVLLGPNVPIRNAKPHNQDTTCNAGRADVICSIRAEAQKRLFSQLVIYITSLCMSVPVSYTHLTLPTKA